MICYHCGMERRTTPRIGREEACRGCGVYLHCCLNCAFYSETAHHQCREPEAEFVHNKKSANFCDFFTPGSAPDKTVGNRADDARRKLNELFGD